MSGENERRWDLRSRLIGLVNLATEQGDFLVLDNLGETVCS